VFGKMDVFGKEDVFGKMDLFGKMDVFGKMVDFSYVARTLSLAIPSSNHRILPYRVGSTPACLFLYPPPHLHIFLSLSPVIKSLSTVIKKPLHKRKFQQSKYVNTGICFDFWNSVAVQ